MATFVYSGSNGRKADYIITRNCYEYGYSSIFIEVLADNPTLNFYLRYSANMIEENIIKLGDENLLEYILRIDFTDWHIWYFC